MPNRVLVARPNDFIVNFTTESLVRAGFEPVVSHSAEEFAEHLKQPLTGVVISTAVSSQVALSLGQVFQAVRKKHPTVPVAVTTMSTLATAETAVRAELGAQSVVDSASLHAELGTTNVLLCLRRDALSDHSADAALKQHFTPRPS